MNDADSGKTVKSLALFDDNEDSNGLVEITTLIRPDQAFALELLESARQTAENNNFDKASLFQEALDLLIEKHIVAVRLGNNKMIKDKNSVNLVQLAKNIDNFSFD